MIAPVVPRPLLAAALAAVLLGILLAGSPFPPGADPGHMLALSYALEGRGPEGELGYAPGLPALMLLARQLAGDDTSLLFFLVKVLGVLCLLAEAGGLAAYAGALAGRSAAQWTFVLAAWNPNSWNQLLWGGYAQMLAIGLGGCALALFVRRRYLLSGALAGAVVLTHLYSAIFFAVAGMALALRERSPRSALSAPAAIVVALPSLPAHVRFFDEMTLGRPLEGYAVSLAEIAQNLLFHPAIHLLMALLLALALGARSPAARRVWPFLVACGVLFAVTPSLHVARAGLFAWHGAVLFTGISFALEGASRLVRAVLFLIPLVSFVELTTLVSDYAPLERHHAEAMRRLASEAQGRVLIVSPTPNVDGWWYEGLTGEPALIGDDLRWALMREQQERSVAARTIVHATRVGMGESLRELTLEVPGMATVTSLWIKDVEYFPLIELRRLDESRALLTPGPGGRISGVRSDGDRIALRGEYFYDRFRWKGFVREATLEVSAEEPWSAQVSANAVRLQGAGLELRFDRSGFREVGVEDLLAQWNVSHVWVRDDPQAASRFALDPRFEELWNEAGVSAFRLAAGMPGSLDGDSPIAGVDKQK